MPKLSEVRHSREAAVAAASEYFGFLAKMYLDESNILRPPEGGWPEITVDRLKGLGKTDEVVMLLRHLPYLRPTIRIEGCKALMLVPVGVGFTAGLTTFSLSTALGQASRTNLRS